MKQLYAIDKVGHTSEVCVAAEPLCMGFVVILPRKWWQRKARVRNAKPGEVASGFVIIGET